MFEFKALNINDNTFTCKDEVARNKNEFPMSSILTGRCIEIPKNFNETMAEFDLEQMGANDFYNLWDDLARNSGGYLQRHTGGTDAVGNKLDYYIWTPRMTSYMGMSGEISQYEKYNASVQSYPSMFITACIHGNEKQGGISFYYLFKQWMNGQVYGKYILDNMMFVILPCCNPSGMNSNTRLNHNGVNLNRNFPYGWNNYHPTQASDNKGSAPLSEKESKFMLDTLMAYHNSTYVRNMIVVSLHDFHYTLHNKQIMWWTTNDREIRYHTAKISSYLIDKIIGKFPELERGSVNDEYITWNSQGTTPDFDNEARVRGFKDLLLEVPDNMDSQFYGEKSTYCGYMLQANCIVNMLDICWESSQRQTYLDWYEIGLTTDTATIETVAQNLPRGAVFEHFIGTEDAMQAYLPKYDGNAYRGVLRIERSSSTSWDTNKSATVMWVTTSSNTTRVWYNSVGADGLLNNWMLATSAVWGLDEMCTYEGTHGRTDITLQNIIDHIPTNGRMETYVGNEYCTALYNGMPVQAVGYLRVTRPSYSGARQVYLEYIRASNGDVYRAMYSASRGLHWIKYTGEAV